MKGPEHPDTLTTRYGLAKAILNQGRAGEAEGLFRDLLPVKEMVLGPEHPDTLTTRFTLARAILNQGRAGGGGGPVPRPPAAPGEGGGPGASRVSRPVASAQAALEQGEADRATAALARVPKDGGDPHPVAKGRAALLRGWIADLAWDAARAERPACAEAHLADLDPQHYARRQLARYRETRVPGRPGGTMAPAAPRDRQEDDDDPQPQATPSGPR